MDPKRCELKFSGLEACFCMDERKSAFSGYLPRDESKKNWIIYKISSTLERRGRQKEGSTISKQPPDHNSLDSNSSRKTQKERKLRNTLHIQV